MIIRIILILTCFFVVKVQALPVTRDTGSLPGWYSSRLI